MKRLLCMVLSAIMSCFLLTGCAVEVQEEAQDSGGNQYYLYYVNKDETKLEKESYHPEKETAEFMLKDLVTILNEQKTQGDKGSLLPKEVQINSYNLNEAVLELEFNSQYGSISRAREILVRAGTVRTFLQVPGIAGVKFYVGKNELLDTKGEPVGVMDNSAFAELWGSDRSAYRYDTFTLYFTDKTGEKLLEEKRNVYYKRSLPRERVVLEQLAKGPMVKGHYPTIPENTEVLGALIADKVCYADFSSVFKDYQLDIPVKTVIYSVVNSLLGEVEADKVQILIDGNDSSTLADGTSLYNFFGWNEEMIAGGEESQ